MSLVDLSVDLGEATTEEEQRVEEAIWPLVTSVNIACGGHVGNEASMRHAARRARELGVQFGAHPSYPDRENFGRRSLDIDTNALREALAEQLRALQRIAGEEGVTFRHVKPHGALYNDAHLRRDLAETIVDAVQDVDPTLELVGSSRSECARVAEERGLTFVAEAFADRRYRANGELTSRRDEGSLLIEMEKASEQAMRLVTERVAFADDGSVIPISFRTLCLHGDMEGAVERIRAVRSAIERVATLSASARRLP